MPSSVFTHIGVATWTLAVMPPRFIVVFVLLGSGISAQYDQCTGNTSWIGNGWCDALNNNAACGYDGGDCCYCSCLDGLEYTCGSFSFDCLDPEYAGNEVFDCIEDHITDVPCSPDTLTHMTVNDTASATALVDAIRCSGGVFNVQWVGHVVVSRTIEVANGTVLTVTGVGSGAVMQAMPGTRLIAVIDASLEISNMKISGGNAIFGGGIAAVGSYMSLANTSFSGNDAVVEGGALYAAYSTIVFWSERTVFDENYAGSKGGAVSVRGAPNVTFDGNISFMNNIAGDDGGALNVYYSNVYWGGDSVFSDNTAYSSGGALFVRQSTVSWAGGSLFFNNSADVDGGAIYASSSTVSWEGFADFYDNIAEDVGGALAISYSTASWTGAASFSENTAHGDGGALYGSHSAVFCESDAAFLSNTAFSYGGAVILWDSNVSWEADAVFSNNSAMMEGGALRVTSSTVSWGGWANFSDNVAHDDGGAVAGIASTISWEGDAAFLDNTAFTTGGAVVFWDSSVSWVGGANFIDNIAHDHGGALAGIASTVSLAGDAAFLNNTAFSFGGAVILWDSNASWEADAVFSNNSAVMGGGALYASSSSVSWVGSANFIDNIAHDDGGAVAGSASTISWAGDAAFLNNTAFSFGGAVILWDSNVSWEGNAVFFDNIAHDHGGALAGTASNVSLAGDAFFLGNIASFGGGGLIVWESSVSWAGNAVFSHNTVGELGGVAYVSTSSNLSWSGNNVVFSNNSAKIDGGALYVSTSSEIFFGGQAFFLDNTAGRNGGAFYIRLGARALLKMNSLLLGNSASGDGGALYIYGKDEEQTTSVNFTGTAKFLNNLCGGDGGALVIVAAGWVTLPSQKATFSHNSAHASGGAIAVKGSAIGPQFTGLTFLENRAQIGGAVYVTSSGTATTGNQFGDLVHNPTTFDGCNFISNEAKATGGAIDTRAGLDTIANSNFEGNSARAGGALRLAGITSLDNCTFTENTSYDGEGAAVSNVGSISSMIACSFDNNTFVCKAGEFLDYQETNSSSRGFWPLVCRGCDVECVDCTTSSRAPACTEVLEHTDSTGGNTTIEALEIDRGYWRATKTSRKVLACYNADACIGGVTGSVDYCRSGYEGPYCCICREGYSPGVGHTCSRCSASIGSVVVAVIIVAVSILVVVLLLSYLVCGRGTGGGQGLLASWRRRLLSLKIIIIVWQVTTQFASVANVIYPKIYRRFLDHVDVVNFDVSWVLSAECIVTLDFHHRLIMSTLGPSAALAILGGMYAVRRWRNRASHEDFQVASNEEVRQKYISLVLLLTFLVYSSVSSTLFQMFACDELDDGKSYLRADYRIDCNSSTHTTLQAYAVCMMFFYTGGIPVVYGILLFSNRQALMDESARQEGAETRSISNLWELYKPHRFYYELIECARRILLAGVVVFIFPNTAAQVGIALMIAAFFMVFSEMVAPYESVWDAWVNRFGHALVFGSIYLALLLKIDVSGEREDSQRLFETTLIAGHIFMFLLATSGVVVVTYQWINRGG